MANPPNVYEFLFPQGDSLCAVSDSGRFLKDKDDRELAKSCLVRKVSHFKEDNGVHHELVLIDVFSSVNPNRTTFLESERCGGEVPQRQNSSPSPSGSSASISTLSNKSSKGLNADDKIFIPGIKIRENETFDKRSKILCTTNTLLYTVTLSKPCSIAQLLVMLNVLHNSSPNYTLLEKQCYWFAGTLCEMLRVKFEGKVSDNADERKAGKYKFIPVTRPSVQPEVLVKYDEAWKEFCDREDQEQQDITEEQEKREREIAEERAIRVKREQEIAEERAIRMKREQEIAEERAIWAEERARLMQEVERLKSIHTRL